MYNINDKLNNLLINTFNVILKIQEIYIKKIVRTELSISEIHVIEKIGYQGENGINVTNVANALGITIPSATVSLNKLSQKGYINKVKSDCDGRTYFCFLTDKGKEVFSSHQEFHNEMISNLIKSLNKEEISVLSKGIQNLNNFFNDTLDSLKYNI